MKRPCFLGIDVGTSSTKATLVDATGSVVCAATVATGVRSPEPGWAEHDAEEDWWGSVVRACRGLEALLPDRRLAGMVASVGACGLFPSLVPLRRDGTPLRRAILYGIDARCGAEARELERAFGREAILAGTGNVMSVQSVAAKLLWLKRNEPDVFRGASDYLDAVGYVVLMLTGVAASDAVRASSSLAFDVAHGTWNEGFLDFAGIARDSLPRIRPSQEVVGRVSGSAARETGLSPGTPVVTGTGDVAAEVVSAVTWKENRVLLTCGSTFCVVRGTGDYRPSETIGLCSGVGGTPFLLIGGSTAGGNTREWALSLLGGSRPAGPDRGSLWPASDTGDDEDGTPALDELAARVQPGAEGIVVVPYLRGERAPVRDPDAKGVVFGLTAAHGSRHVYRAFLEGVAYAVRHILEEMDRLVGSRCLAGPEGAGPRCLAGSRTGSRPADGRVQVMATGRAATPLWTRILADVTGSPVTRVPASSASRGAALLAAIGTGHLGWADLSVPEPLETYQPDARNHAVYDRCYEVYGDIYSRLKHLMREAK